MCVRFPDYATTEVVEQRQEQLGQEGPRRFVILQLLLWLSPLPSAPLSPPHHHPLTHLSPHPSAPSISSSTFLHLPSHMLLFLFRLFFLLLLFHNTLLPLFCITSISCSFHFTIHLFWLFLISTGMGPRAPFFLFVVISVPLLPPHISL